MPLLGAHMSIGGGVHRAVERGAEVSCDAIQLFTSSNQQWRTKPIKDAEAALFRDLQLARGIAPAVAHASYLINMASPDRRLRRRSSVALVEEIERCDRLGLPYLIIHPGAHMGTGEEAAFDAIAGLMDGALQKRPASRTMILLENTAGMGTSVGHRFEHLREILGRLEARERVAICIDTCHLFAAGYDISTERGYQRVMEELDRTLGLDQVRTFHLNDSKKGLGCRLDRHEHIGAGSLGVIAFWCLLNDGRFDGVPMLLETPKGPDLTEDRTNLALLRAQVGSRRPVTGPTVRVAVRRARPARSESRAGGARSGTTRAGGRAAPARESGTSARRSAAARKSRR